MEESSTPTENPAWDSPCHCFTRASNTHYKYLESPERIGHFFLGPLQVARVATSLMVKASAQDSPLPGHRNEGTEEIHLHHCKRVLPFSLHGGVRCIPSINVIINRSIRSLPSVKHRRQISGSKSATGRIFFREVAMVYGWNTVVTLREPLLTCLFWADLIGGVKRRKLGGCRSYNGLPSKEES